MTETVIPATYVEVRAEGLSSAGGVGAGVVGVVGTAAGGVVGEAVTPGGLADAREVSGAPDEYGRPLGEVPLTLVRALELGYVNGASSVFAVRVAGAARDAAAFVLKNATGGAVATLTARHPGTDGNGIRVLVTQADGPAGIVDETHTPTFMHLRHAHVPTATSAPARTRRAPTVSWPDPTTTAPASSCSRAGTWTSVHRLAVRIALPGAPGVAGRHVVRGHGNRVLPLVRRSSARRGRAVRGHRAGRGTRCPAR